MHGPYVQIILFYFTATLQIIHNFLNWSSSFFLFFLNEVYIDNLRNPKTQVLKSQTVRALGYYTMIITWWNISITYACKIKTTPSCEKQSR